MTSPIDGLDRRALLKGAIAAGLVGGSFSSATAAITFRSYPFTLGVASGDPTPSGFILWTRLAPDPLHETGGMANVAVDVTWQVANDLAFTQIVQSGVYPARPQAVHTVHASATGLLPDRVYFYRFMSGGAVSQVGRCRTLPALGSATGAIRLISAGCQEWESGFFTAWRHIANESAHAVFHSGDYIYEASSRQYPYGNARALPFTTEAATLTDYRKRYALYKTDRDLQAAHASCAFLVSFDDHEVVNNWWSDTDKRNTPPATFLARRAAAFQAWYEHMPVRRRSFQFGSPDILAYRSYSYGSSLDLAVLDTRQYRDIPACTQTFTTCPEADAPGRTMLGPKQERWLAGFIQNSSSVWQCYAQQVLMTRLDWRSWVNHGSGEPEYRMDAWDGASNARQRMVTRWLAKGDANPVVLTGDTHKAMAMEIVANPADPESQCVGVEFGSTSISSGGNGTPTLRPNDLAFVSANPNLRYFADERGYNLHVITPTRWRCDYKVVSQVKTQGGTLALRKSFSVEPGLPGINS